MTLGGLNSVETNFVRLKNYWDINNGILDVWIECEEIHLNSSLVKIHSQMEFNKNLILYVKI